MKMESIKKDVCEFVWIGRVCQVIDPHYFWMQLGTRENLLQFEQLQKDMQAFVYQGWYSATSIDDLEPGTVVLVKSDSEKGSCLKRGQVARVMQGDSVDVFYVDYGNTELKAIDKICINVPAKFKLCPPQAVRCSLAGVKPLVKSWTSRGIKTFQQFTGNKLLNVLVLYGEPGYYEVALYPSDEDNGRSVGHSLVTEEVAMMFEEQLVPEFLQDIPSFMTQSYLSSPPGGVNSATSTDNHTDEEKKISSTPPTTEKYIPPHQKNMGSSPGSAGSNITNQNTSSPQNSLGGHKYSNSGSKPNSYTSRSPGSKAKEPVNDFFPFDNVSVYPPSPNSPVKSPVKDYGFSSSSPRSRPKLNIPHSNVAQPPFYPPSAHAVDNVSEYAEQKTWNLTAPHEFERSQPQYGLNPPAFYQSHLPPPPLNQPAPYSSQQALPVSPIKQHGNTFRGTSSPIKVSHQDDFNTRYNQYTTNNHHHDNYQTSEYRLGNETNNTRSTMNSNHNYLNHNNSNNGGRASVKVPLPSTPSKYHGYDPSKMSPESPDSPAIAAFNLGDLEHTQMTSTDHFHQQLYHERLQALHEEAEEIAKESKEQSELVNYSRYAGLRGQFEESGDYMPVSNDLDVLDQIALDIQDTSAHSYRDHEDIKRSPVKEVWKNKDDGKVAKLGEIPKSYIADINFTDAVKEALESGKTNGMDNAKALLEGIVESLKLANVDKQLYDVLCLMLSKAVKEYNLFHTIVMETINMLNDNLEIKESLAKALKRQQELCVRVPAPRHPQHLNFSKVMAHVYNMALDWSDSNASIQDGILQTVEKWILFNNKGSQIGQEDKENVFLDCFGAFWEVSGTHIIQHNQAFKARISNEVREKLLNEAVQRSIRERLLDITLELFTLSTEKRNVCTQTQRRTMIPSSCQVRPSTCDKATFMESEWQDEGFKNLEMDALEHMNWQVNTDYASPDSTLSLRPLGRGGPLLSQSSPKDSFYSTKSSDTLDSPSAHDLSKGSNISDSVYVTPGETRASCSSSKSDKNDVMNGAKEKGIAAHSPKENSRKNLVNSLKADFEDFEEDDVAMENTKDSELSRDFQGGNLNMNNNNASKTVTEQKSAIGKSIVDWFDYEPPAVEKVRNGVKLEEKRLETKKKLDSTSMEIIEHEYAPTKDLTKKKSKKNKEKKHEKTNVLVDNRKEEKEKVIDSGAFENSLQQAIRESLQDTENVTVKTADCVEVDTDENIDWWAIGEGGDTKYCEDDMRMSRGDNIFIDNGPDVIIEDEFEQEDNAEINKVAEEKVEPKGTTDCENHLHVVSKTDKSLSDSDVGDIDMVVQQKIDNFAFELDDDDDDEKWDSESSEDLNVNAWVGLQQDNPGYQEDFPEIDPRTVLPSRNESLVPSADTMCSDRKYESSFPKTNLAEFVNVNEECDIEERPRATRWVPGRRKCMNCYSEDHTTESCQQFVIMQ